MCNGSRLNALYKTNVDEADTSSVSGIIDEGDDEDQRVSDRRSNEQLLSDAEERRRERKLALIRKDIADLNTIVRNLALHVQQQQSYEIGTQLMFYYLNECAYALKQDSIFYLNYIFTYIDNIRIL